MVFSLFWLQCYKQKNRLYFKLWHLTPFTRTHTHTHIHHHQNYMHTHIKLSGPKPNPIGKNEEHELNFIHFCEFLFSLSEFSIPFITFTSYFDNASTLQFHITFFFCVLHFCLFFNCSHSLLNLCEQKIKTHNNRKQCFHNVT